MAKIELTVQKDYIDWDLGESVRELVQNGLDAQTDGHEFSMSYRETTRTLGLYTKGVTLEPKTLLVGYSTKRERRDLIGQYGEGYKLALLALVREGYEVIIRTGSDRWTPAIEPSTVFNGEEVLVIDVAKSVNKYRNAIEVDIRGVTPSDWDELQGRFLFLQDEGETLKGRNGVILLEEKFQGKVFVGGLYVEYIETLEYGYNLDPSAIQLDRDRRMVDRYQLEDLTGGAWGFSEWDDAAFEKVWGNLLRGSLDTKNMCTSWNISDKNMQRIVDKYIETYGAETVPVRDEVSRERMIFLGRKSVVVSESLSYLLARSLRVPTYLEVENDMKNLILSVVPFQDLPTGEQDNLRRAQLMVSRVEALTLEDIKVTVFRDPEIEGWYEDGQVHISAVILNDFVKTLKVLIHETAHRTSGAWDGHKLHIDEIERLWSQITAGLLE